jgi:hypothetical protein
MNRKFPGIPARFRASERKSAGFGPNLQNSWLTAKKFAGKFPAAGNSQFIEDVTKLELLTENQVCPYFGTAGETVTGTFNHDSQNQAVIWSLNWHLTCFPHRGASGGARLKAIAAIFQC